jgi:RHS repeat-associated protein
VIPGSSYAYTPFGVVASGNTPDPFGFTGELHSEGLVYLRARWYDPSVGTFTSRDPFAGYPQTPYSLHYYQYGYSNPLLWTDASGEGDHHKPGASPFGCDITIRLPPPAALGLYKVA